MLTSGLHLSSAGPNSAPLAVPLLTPSSAHSSVPDELLKMLKPAGGQGRCWPGQEVAFSGCASFTEHTCARYAACWGPCSLPRRSVGLPHPPLRLSIPATGNLQGDRLKWETCPLHQTQIPNPAAVTTCSGTLGKSLSLYPSGRRGWIGPKGPLGPSKRWTLSEQME